MLSPAKNFVELFIVLLTGYRIFLSTRARFIWTDIPKNTIQYLSNIKRVYLIKILSVPTIKMYNNSDKNIKRVMVLNIYFLFQAKAIR